MNSNFAPEQFLRSHWQQKPVLLSQLIPGFSDIISPEELAGLACEDLVESRLVYTLPAQRWSVRHGPFAEAVMQSLGATGWTLLVQAVDQWMPAVAELKSSFAFLPNWRLDDVMVSYAVEGAGVGPHFDNYDVFLLQGSGQRRWQLGNRVGTDVQLDDQEGIGILQDFVPAQEFVLNPGDALYIPPQYPHWGHSMGNSTCYSIGFRAPSLAQMLEGFSDRLIASSQPAERFTDLFTAAVTDPVRIDNNSLQQAFQQLQGHLTRDTQFIRWFGCFATQPKYPELIEALRPPMTSEEVREALQEGSLLRHHPSSRFAYWIAEKGDELLLFVDGEAMELPPKYREVVSSVCTPTALNSSIYSENQGAGQVLAVILQLLNQGSLQLH